MEGVGEWKLHFPRLTSAKRHQGPLILSSIVEVVAHESRSACVVMSIVLWLKFCLLADVSLVSLLQIMEFPSILLQVSPV